MNETVVVFGSLGGVGSSVVDRLKSEGFTVLGVDISEESSSKRVNLSDYFDVEHFFNKHIDVSIVVNCVGMNYPAKLGDAADIWDQTYNANVKTLANILNSTNSEDNRIRLYINLCSNSGFIPRTNSSAYCSSKAAVRMLVRSSARELASKHKTVIGIDPGYLEGTKMSLNVEQVLTDSVNTLENFKKQMLSRIPIRRFVTVEEVADLVSYLCKHKSPDCFTGTNIEIAGGEI